MSLVLCIKLSGLIKLFVTNTTKKLLRKCIKMTLKEKILLSVFIAFSFGMFYAEGIKCYQCNSLTDSECSTLKANDTNSFLYRECEEGKYTSKKVFCRKIVQVISDRNNLVRVIRKCSWEPYSRSSCYYVSNADHTEVVCQCYTDGCNSAKVLQGSLLVSVFTLILTKLLI